MANDRLPQHEKLRIVEEMLADPRIPPPPQPLTTEEKLDLFDHLVAQGAINPDNPADRLPQHEKLRIVDEVLTMPDCPIPREAIPLLTTAMKLELFDHLVEGGAIHL